MAIDVVGLAPLLQVFDMPTSIAFYCDVLSFQIVHTSRPGPHFGWALLRLGDVELMLNTAYESHARPAQPDPLRRVGHGDTILYFRCPDVDAAYSYLRQKGVDLKPPVIQPYGMKQLYMVDPDGYGLCFQWAAEQQT